MTRKTKLAVIDDHPMVRRGIAETFAVEPDFTVMAQGGSAEDAVRIAEEMRPDLMLLDVTMPGGGIAAAAAIRKTHPDARIAMLSIKEDLATVREALRAGARGYISKGVEGNELVDCARKIMAGELFVSPALAARLLTLDTSEDHGEAARGSPAKPHASNLTQREDQIFRLLGDGLSNSEIGQRLGLSENTVKHYLTPLFYKLGARNRTEAALLARGKTPGQHQTGE